MEMDGQWQKEKEILNSEIIIFKGVESKYTESPTLGPESNGWDPELRDRVKNIHPEIYSIMESKKEQVNYSTWK